MHHNSTVVDDLVSFCLHKQYAVYKHEKNRIVLERCKTRIQKYLKYRTVGNL